MPASADRTRRAIDRVFGVDPAGESVDVEDGQDLTEDSDGLETA